MLPMAEASPSLYNQASAITTAAPTATSQDASQKNSIGVYTRNINKEFPFPVGWNKIHENQLMLEIPPDSICPNWWEKRVQVAVGGSGGNSSFNNKGKGGNNKNSHQNTSIGLCFLRLARTNVGRYQLDVRYLGHRDPTEFGNRCIQAYCRDIDIVEKNGTLLITTHLPVGIDVCAGGGSETLAPTPSTPQTFVFKFAINKKLCLTLERLQYAKELDQSAPKIDLEALKRKGLTRAPLRKEERTPTKFKHFRPGKFDPNARWATPRAIPGVR